MYIYIYTCIYIFGTIEPNNELGYLVNVFTDLLFFYQDVQLKLPHYFLTSQENQTILFLAWLKKKTRFLCSLQCLKCYTLIKKRLSQQFFFFFLYFSHHIFLPNYKITCWGKNNSFLKGQNPYWFSDNVIWISRYSFISFPSNEILLAVFCPQLQQFIVNC